MATDLSQNVNPWIEQGSRTPTTKDEDPLWDTSIQRTIEHLKRRIDPDQTSRSSVSQACIISMRAKAAAAKARIGYIEEEAQLTLSQTSPGFLQYRFFENIVGKREIAHNEQFLFFPQCLLLV